MFISKSGRRTWRRSVVAAAAGMCLASIVMAQQSAGSINGRAAKGDTVTVENRAINVNRTIRIDSDGAWQIPQLPPGTYQVTLTRAGGKKETVEVVVTAGQGANAGFAQAVTTITVTGSAIRTIDVGSVATAYSLNAAEIQRIPVEQNVTAVTLLSPGAVQGDGRFGNLPSISGASVAENAYYVNGFNVTNILKGIAFNAVPFEGIGSIQVKNSGYGAEYGRSLGGVISVTTKRGTNEWMGGGKVSLVPESLRGSSVYARRTSPGQYELVDRPGGTDTKEVNVYAGGPIIKDKLFVFGLIQAKRTETKTYGADTQSAEKSSTPQYVLKLDWQITDNHRVELTTFSDKQKRTENSWNSPTEYQTAKGAFIGKDEYTTGGTNTIAQWTGFITDSLTLSAMYGSGEYSRETKISTAACPAVYDGRPPRTQLEYLGCWSEAAGIAVDDPNANDKRTAFRFDADLVLGSHTLRAGLDNEVITTVDGSVYTGGFYDRLFTLAPGGSIGGTGYTNTTGAPIDYVRRRVFQNGGTFKTKNSAWYIQDDWQVTPNIVVNLGLRNESFRNENDKGQAFIEVKNTWAPRAGVSWDVKGDGKMKLYGNAGRYYIPVYANTNVRLSGAETFYGDFFLFTGGFSNDGKSVPNIGAQLGNRVVTSDGQPKDPRTVVDPNIKPLFQDEFIVGFQQALADRWSYGVKYTNRQLKSAIDDVCEGTLAREWALANGYTSAQAGRIGSTVGGCFLYNVGGDLTANIDVNGNGTLTPVTIPASALFLPKPKRSYNALEFTLERQWDKKWSAQFSYVLAYSKGNTEGYVKSDNGQDDAGITQDFDHPGLMEGSEGYLPNDRRHTLKFNGAYAISDQFRVGATLVVTSGRPKNCFGNYPEVVRDANGNPVVPAPYPPGPLERDDSDAYGAASFYCGAKLNPRGSLGRLPWTYDLGLQFTYTPTQVKGLTLSVDVLNVFNKRGVRSIDEVGETDAVNSVSPTYQRPILSGLQPARAVRLTAAYEF
jgi:hypothetical protein